MSADWQMGNKVGTCAQDTIKDAGHTHIPCLAFWFASTSSYTQMHTGTNRLAGTPLPKQEELPLEKSNLCQHCWLFSTPFHPRLSRRLHADAILSYTIGGHKGSGSVCNNYMINLNKVNKICDFFFCLSCRGKTQQLGGNTRQTAISSYLFSEESFLSSFQLVS